MIFLKNDYSQGAHPRVIKALTDTNMVYTDGYGIDPYCNEAETTIKNLIKSPNSQVHFLMAGTQTNLTAIAAFLKPHHAVISPDTGHICVHEAGAIEATGHKVIHVPAPDGKIYPDAISHVMKTHEDEHYVKPKLLYISNSTETGNIYKKNELIALRNICDKHDLLLYIDGARLAMALACKENDLSIADLAKYADAFYIGGTKNGILFGEALVLVNHQLMEDFRYLLKQRGAILAKGRLLGVQFQEVFRDNLYFQMGEHANNMASYLAQGIRNKGYDFEQVPMTNLLFPIFPTSLIASLSDKVMFEGWRDFGNTAAIRLVTSWSTTKEEIDEFLSLI